MPRKATSQDVADLAGVSRSAVSLVLNGRGAGNIAADKQALIIEAARKLDYTPNAVALSLRSRRSSTIGVVTDAITTASGGELVQGAADVALDAGYLVLTIDTRQDQAREHRAYALLQDRQVDGFLFAAMRPRSYLAPSVLRGAASALANCFDDSDRVPAFIPDEVGGSRAVTQYLIDRGHRDVVMLAGPNDAVAPGLREQGYRQAMSAAGLTAPSRVPTGSEIGQGYAAAMHLLSADQARPTALVCANDRVAVGVVLAAAQLGLSVPADVSVVGYDNDENVAPWLVPALTTVRLPHREMGERAMAAVLAGVLDDAPATLETQQHQIPRTLLECSLVVRDSVAPPR